jgi:hypothetical protein
MSYQPPIELTGTLTWAARCRWSIPASVRGRSRQLYRTIATAMITDPRAQQPA